MSTIRTELEERFLRYVQIDTTSNEFSAEVPSTARQYDLLNLLVTELEEMGASDIKITDYATVFGTIPATDPDPIFRPWLTLPMSTPPPRTAAPMSNRLSTATMMDLTLRYLAIRDGT